MEFLSDDDERMAVESNASAEYNGYYRIQLFSSTSI